MIHQPVAQLSLAQLQKKASGRWLYVWGAGNQGRGIAKVLFEQNIKVTGFIDSSSDLIGTEIAKIPVFAPSVIENHEAGQVFIIIATFFHGQTIAEKCQEHGLRENDDFIFYYHLKPRDYSIDVSGHCNLCCIACPRGTKRQGAATGLMKLAVFKQVIEKIKKEDPFVGNIQLYQWGEPTLNNELPEMIRYAASRSINSAISSNLNTRADFSRILAAKPEWLRLSASGWNNDYEITHTGGKWQIFITNLSTVANLRKKLHPQMKIELFYHLYHHSTGKGFQYMADLCQELDIEFHPVYAYLISLDDVLAYLEGTPLPHTAEQARKLMLLKLEQGLEIAKSERHLVCDTIRSIHINPDLSVSNCMMYYYTDGNRAVDNYLTSSLADIMNLRMQCKLCKRCMKHGMHRYCLAYSTFTPDLKVLSK